MAAAMSIKLQVQLEQVNCPICMDVTKTEMNQCRNGHLICRECGVAQTVCPQCLVEFETPKIRNLLAEVAMDEESPCPFQYKGCDVKVKGRLLESHSENCKYKLNTVCGLLIATDCDFNSTTSEGLLYHLLECHKLTHSVIANYSLMLTTAVEHLRVVEPDDSCIVSINTWVPFPNEKVILLQCIHFDRWEEDRFPGGKLSLLCVHLDNEGIQSQIRIEYEITCNNKVVFKWTGRPTPFTNLRSQSVKTIGQLNMSIQVMESIAKEEGSNDWKISFGAKSGS